MFGDEFAPKLETSYTSKIKGPVYEPKNKKPNVLELYDNLKANRLINEINASNIPDDEKKFLIEAAKRHIVFNYSKIADFYAHSSKETQELMEKSALVIVDFESAYQNGFLNLATETANIYLDCNE